MVGIVKERGETAQVLGPALTDALGGGQVGAAVLAVALLQRAARGRALGTHGLERRREIRAAAAPRRET